MNDQNNNCVECCGEHCTCNSVSNKEITLEYVHTRDAKLLEINKKLDQILILLQNSTLSPFSE